MKIEVQGLCKSFGDLPVLRGVSLEVNQGELVALLGPSGCGKTTLLRIIAGLEHADDGMVLFGGEDVTGRNVRDRQLGFVFQHYALFRHMTVFENVAFGLQVRPRRRRPPGEEIRRRVTELLHLVKLEAQANHLPSQLSGGQRQRVALARALAVEPRVLLLDEPFGSLDAQVRKALRIWLRRLHDELQLTSLFVTHDQEEALELADRVAVMNDGQVIQIGSPEEVYKRPINPFVYHFLGSVNLFHGRSENGAVRFGQAALKVPHAAVREGPVMVYVRPHLLEIAPDGGGEHAFRARVRYVNAAGPTVKVELMSEWGEPVSVELSHERYGRMTLSRDREVYVRVAAEHLLVTEAPAARDAVPAGDSAHDSAAVPADGAAPRPAPSLDPPVD